MKKRRSKIWSNTRQAQQNNISRREKKLTAFAKKIVTDTKDNGIEKIHIISGGVKVLSKTVNRDEIIVRVPSRTQAGFLKNYINGAASNEIPFQIEYTTWSKLSKLPRPIGCDLSEIIGIGAMPKAGRQINLGNRRGARKPIVGIDDGTGERDGKTPPGSF